MDNFNNIIEKTLKHEGGYVDDPKDAGGETNFGISKRSYPNEDIKNLTLDKAKEIYRKDYWDKIRGDNINDNNVASEIFDTAVNMGAKTASKLAQTTCESFTDGIIGSNTLKAINAMDSETFVIKFKLAKIARYAYITEKYPNNKKFLLGWIKRSLV